MLEGHLRGSWLFLKQPPLEAQAVSQKSKSIERFSKKLQIKVYSLHQTQQVPVLEPIEYV